jgi:SPP1 gp7 family putative phage head morphogenesis protein
MKTKKNKNVVFEGKRLHYNAAQQLRYKAALSKLTKKMINETITKIINLFKKSNSKEFFEQQAIVAEDESIAAQAKKLTNALINKFSQLFSSKSGDLAKNMLEDAKTSSAWKLKGSLKDLSKEVSLNTSVVPKGMEEVSQATINENVNLIKSIPQKYLANVSGAVMRSITAGNGLYDLLPELKKYSGETDRRVTNLALDQTRKAYNNINKQRMQKLGIKKFKWLHSGGSQHPRKSHMAISGNIYSFDDLPLKGEEGFVNGQIPGQAINCRCTMTPIIVLDTGEEI